MIAKRILLLAFGALLLLGFAQYFAPSIGSRYRADALVFAKPYTNVLFSLSFEAGLARMIPGILRLQVFTT